MKQLQKRFLPVVLVRDPETPVFHLQKALVSKEIGLLMSDCFYFEVTALSIL